MTDKITTKMTNIKIEHDETKQVFYFIQGEKQGELNYSLKGKVMDMTHTGVPEDLRGNGYGTELVSAAIEFARARGYRIIPTCPFVEAFVRKNKSAQALLSR